MKTRAPQFLIILLIACLVSQQNGHAVSPPPDGGYPGQNTAEGALALLHLNGGTNNTAIGWASLGFDVTGNLNTAVGSGTLLFNTADSNTATGAGALLNNTTGGGNTANGAFALSSNTTGGGNTAIGKYAFQNNTTGGGNTAVGTSALQNNTAGNGNTAVGFQAGLGVTTATNVICIGAGGSNVDDSCYIGNTFGATSANGVAVLVNSNGRLGTMTSSRRFKEDIKPMDHASEPLFSLKPVTFRYKKGIDPEGPEHKSEFGLVAEDVERTNPDLVVRDKEGKPYSVRYDQVNAMLLNEFLKEHKIVQEQGAIIARQQKQIDALAAGLQKVSAQLELNKAPSQLAHSNQ